MNNDPIMTEVHRVKDALSAKYGHDVRQLGKALQQAQKRTDGTYTSFPPRLMPTTKKKTFKGGKKQPRVST